MTTYSKILSLIAGVPRTTDLSNTSNALGVANLQLLGSTSGYLQFATAATTTSYSLVWPSAQGAASTFLQNNGSGTLSWSPISSAPAISGTFTAGQGFTADTSYVVRWGMNVLSESTDRVYAADYSTASYDEFWAFGIAFNPGVNVLAGQPITVYSFGSYTLGSNDTPFNSSDIGAPCWLTSAGAFSAVAPTGISESDLKIGIIISTTQIWISEQMMGVGNVPTGAGPNPLEVTNGGTGLSSLTPYAVICGGTGSNTPMQQVSGLGTSGYVLTSNGASALPTWQAAASPVVYSDSIVNNSGTVTLVNDSATPGNTKYYGTNGSGTLGYYSIPATGANTALSNLTTTSINQSLLPASDQIYNIGSSSLGWTNGYINTLKDSSGQDSVRPYNRTLRDSTSTSLLDWGTYTNTVFIQHKLALNNVSNSGGYLTMYVGGASVTPYTILWPSAQASGTQVLQNDGAGNLSWATASSGSVTSVALSDGSSTPIYSISGSPVTGSGTLTFTLDTQTANTVFAGPTTGSAAQPTFRSLVSADIPNNAANTTGTASNVTATSNSTLTTLSALTSASSLATVGTITSGTWNGTTIAIANGGTGQTTSAAAFAALSPMTTAGDIIYENSTPAPARLGIGTDGYILTVVSGLPAWAAAPASGIQTIGTFNSQSTSANGLVISGTTLYAQAATTSNPGMVSVPAAGGLSLSTAALSINTDGSTTKINGSNALESLQPNEEKFTLSGTDITNQYVDLAHAVFGSSASVNSVGVYVVGGPEQQKTVDYTVSLTGGSGGVTRITFAGDLATGGNAALVASDILVVDYSYLA